MSIRAGFVPAMDRYPTDAWAMRLAFVSCIQKTVLMIDPPTSFHRPDPLGIELAQHLSRAIVFGEYPPGSKLVEEVIGARYGISRSPIRDAFRHLEGQGLIVYEARRGVRVTAMSRKDLDEVYACRLPLETLAAMGAARSADPASVVALRTALTTMEEAHGLGSPERYFLENVDFTRALHRASANDTLIRLLAGLSHQALRYRYVAYQRFPDLMTRSVEGNRDLFRAVAAGDADRARLVTEDLIGHSWKQLQGCFGG